MKTKWFALFSGIEWRRIMRMLTTLVGAIVLLLTSAQSFCATAGFPPPNQVAADFSDDAERYVALNILWDTSKAKNPDAKDQRSAYYTASEGIRQKYLVAGGAGYEAFDEKMRHLTADRGFRTKVLEKYQLANLPTQQATPIRRNTDVTDDMIKAALVKALPFMIASLIAMMFVSRILVRSANKISAVRPPRIGANDLPALPESLRVVKLPLLEYSVEMISVIALEKESTVHTHSTTTTTPGQVYSVGNQVYTTPGQTSTHVSTSQVDLIWVRTADGRETSWTFSGDFKARHGHVLSAIVLPQGTEERSDFLMAFNHNTNQFHVFRLIPFGVRTGWAWLVSTLIGSIGFGIAVAIILSIQPDPPTAPIDVIVKPLVDWIMGGMASAILALWIVNRATKKVGEERVGAYRQNYLNQFRQFLEQSTPAMLKRFGAAPAAK
jgi:hypothetical protein